MTVDEHSENPCDHTEDWFDEWDDVYEAEPPELRLIRTCDDCLEQEEYMLRPDAREEFEAEFYTWEQKVSAGEIAHVGLRVDTEKSDGIDAFVDIVIERGESSGEEVVSDNQYYFYG